VHGLVAGAPAIDLDLEVGVQLACRRLIAEGLVKSAHDCSDGGLAVALAECCIAGGVGFQGDFTFPGRWDAALFGEAQSRIVVSLAPADLAQFEKVMSEEAASWTRLGVTGGETVRMAGALESTLADLDNAWRNAIERDVE